ncbi:hypothetical protein [Streptomyces sp. DSM 40484]|uniref:hypothetical protein n=1 Tax=Streptomyces kroppenstedtii TaxID=3051181 RepID=UPI0028D4D22D|nr:hypothetical protein [Streptomyces sp. DSM 40484]
MARVRLIGPEPVTVPELGGRDVQPDEVVEVPDDRFEGYVCQPTTWKAVEEPKAKEPKDEPKSETPPASALKKTAAKAPQKSED